MMPALDLPLTILLSAIVITAATFDFRSRRIPNWLNLAGVALGIAANTFFFGLSGLGHAGLGLGLALLIYLPLYALRGMGAGDVKLMAAVGAIAGPSNWLFIFLCTCLLGGLLAFILVMVKGRLYVTLQNVSCLLSDFARFRRPHVEHPQLDVHSDKSLSLPHGVSIALGSLIFLGVTAAF